MFTNYPNQALSSSVPQLPDSITFNSDPVGSDPTIGSEFNPSFLASAPTTTGFLPHLQPHDPLLQSADLNSPAVFRNNVSIALMEIEKLKMAARTALNSIQNAYQPGSTPQNTQAQIDGLHDRLSMTIQMLSQSGVGALPMLSTGTGSGNSVSSSIIIPTEGELLASTTSSLQGLYDKVQKSQDSAAVVANLLSLPVVLVA